MTRINLIPVSELTDQHLLTEYREVKRVPNLILSGKFNFENQPLEYTLGAWHVKFFYDKILFLHNRYEEIYKECYKRWFSVEYYGQSFTNLKFSNYYNDYISTKEAIELSRQRIEEKIKAKPSFYKYCWKPIL